MSIEHDKAVFPLHKSMCNFNFIITICILEKVLGITYFISKYLQTENIDLSIAIESVELTIQKLQDLRTEETFFSIFHRACEIAKEVGTSPTIPRVVGTQKHRENYAILNNDHVSYYRQSLYYPYLDDILASFNERFKMNSNIFISLSSLLPSKIGNLSFSDIQPAIDFYEEDLRSNNQNIHMDLLKNEFEFWKQKWSNEENNLPKNALDTLSKCPEDLFPHINILLKLLAILPVSTASVERSFSSLKRIKTYLRNSTGEARLNGLALMNIHRDIQIDTDAILNMFASKKERRLDFKL
ncbi:52 kDa repressor of the inhibitor of the protein kinase-like [Metopolophium dirhodum]|nr:52 kDa repressor of the inhibitor of the protein kinase-like [Metopolophium dirhodum]XP_060876385.1 52 kDa repressor of the inhibitor of the protein kinase-like [Metopolophium dirhodum]XP_060880570.1 52 kDa repressor of the inhibitor of the protein kinase-like [Metopolophium dirhodum]